jgi:ketosteroid isomerase-like protein
LNGADTAPTVSLIRLDRAIEAQLKQNGHLSLTGGGNMSDQDSLALLARFNAAWNTHDVEALLDCMTEDGVFQAAAGPPPFGAAATGRDELRRAYAAIWQTYPDAQWTRPRHFASGADACSEWVFTGTKADGSKVEVQGCDLFIIRDGRIAVKNSFRKQVP